MQCGMQCMLCESSTACAECGVPLYGVELVADWAAVGGGVVCVGSAKSFIERYSKYVLQRAKTFTSKFEEMKVIGEVGGWQSSRAEAVIHALPTVIPTTSTSLFADILVWWWSRLCWLVVMMAA